MVCYAILCYGMVWKVWYAMRFQCYAMRFLCYAMVYVVKDKHSATVIVNIFFCAAVEIEYMHYSSRDIRSAASVP